MLLPQLRADGTIRACSYNVRYDADESARVPGETPWAKRRERVFERLRAISPDVVAIQEALSHQFGDLTRAFPDFEWYGVDRQDGERAGSGEFVPIGWRDARFEALQTGHWWLSETPTQPSVGWDGDLPRLSTWAVLRDRQTATTYWACATHLDHRGEQARLEGARLLATTAHGWHTGTPLGATPSTTVEPVDVALVLGDCNCRPDTAPYEAMTGGSLSDARVIADEVIGPRETFHGFEGTPTSRIDYAFVSRTADVDRYRTLEPSDPPYAADHVPIFADVIGRE